MKKVIKLSLLLLALLLPATATAYDYEVDGIYYYVDGNKAFVTDADGNWDTPDYSGDVTIPETVTYNGTTFSVTSIRNQAFYGCIGLTSIVIPNSVTEIGNSAFAYCTGLTSIVIPNSVTSIGGTAFYGCSGLTSVNIGNSVTSIGYDAFSGCENMERVDITDLEAWCRINFSDGSNPCGTAHHLFLNGEEIINLIIPATITKVMKDAFQGCSYIKSVEFQGNISEIGTAAFDACSGLASFDIPNTVTTINNYAFRGCSGLTSVNIPTSVTSIGEGTFEGCSGLISVTIPNSVTSIGSYAFSGCSGLTSIDIPNSVTTIGERAFFGCSGLTSVTIGNSVTSIGSYAFSGCSGLTSIDIPNSVITIGFSAFSACSGLTSATIGNSVTSIDSYAFSGCSGLTSIDIPNSVTTIGERAFFGCSGLTSISIGNSVTSIGERAFYNCFRLHSVFFNAMNCTSIGTDAFGYENNLTNLQFGDSVQHVPAGLPSLYMSGKTLVLPNSVKTIDAGAFSGSCAAVVIGNSIESIATGAFGNGISVAYASTSDPLPCEAGAFANPLTLYVPVGSKNKYFTAPGWSEFANILEGEYVRADSIVLDETNAVLPKGAVLQLNATIIPSSSSARTVNWISQNEAIASVDVNGLVTANAVGETDIVAYVDNVTTTCHVTVTPILVETLTLNDSHLSMSLNEMYTLIAEIKPDNAEDKALEWVIPENDVIATQVVNNNRLNISAEGEGTVTIMVNTTDGSGLSASCEVFVSANTPVKSLTLSPETLNLYVGDSQQLNAIITPQDAYTQDLRWMSSNTNVATVDNNGSVTGRSVGNATITAVTTDGSNLSATCAVTVTNIPVESVTLNTSEMEMYEGNSTYLYATVLPNNAYDRSVTWASSNPRVATVTSNGRVNALEVGTTIITATTNDGTNISAACRVTVINHTASNCFYIPNSEVMHGESVTIPVRLTNDQGILAFQTNIYLPEGFTMVTNENDEFLITPSSRLTSDHVIMADRISDGAIRVICYTPQETPISGNEGDLFYFTVQVPDNAASDYAINLRNSLLTNTDYQELTIPDAGAVITVNTFIPGDVNDSRSVTVTDIVVTAQYILQRNPSPFIFEAADMNGDGNVTVTDIMLIAYLINHPTMNAPKRMPALDSGNDRMSGEAVTLMAGETRTVSILLDNETDYTAFQLDLTLPEGLTASNFQLTSRAGSHAFDVNAIDGDKLRALCYSPAIEVIDGHSGALLTFDVTATDNDEGSIMVDGIEMVTADCQTVLMNGFAIGVNGNSSVNQVGGAKEVARVDYFNLAGQQIDRPESGVNLIVTTYTDGTRSTEKKLIK